MDVQVKMNVLPPINGPPIKFKKLASIIKAHTRWTNLKFSENRYTNFSHERHSARRDSTMLGFNVNAFKSHVVRSCGTVSDTARSHLIKPPWARTAADLKVFGTIVDKLRSLARYPQIVRQELTKVVFYEWFEDGRVMVRQGDVGFSFYFILSGGVTVEVSEKDEKTGQVSTQVVAEMFPGDMFGEVSLLHDIQRTATIICKGKSEFLRIDKPDFDMVLKSSYQREWESRMNYLCSLPELDDFTHKELQQLLATSKFTEYSDNKVLLRDTADEGEFVYFIRSGRCRVVKEMDLVIRSIPFKTPQLILPPQRPQDMEHHELTKFDTLKKVVLIIHILEKGEFFGVGEDCRKTSIVTEGRVEIVQIPRLALVRRKHGMLLSDMREHVKQTFPSPSEVFRSFVKENNWKEYKRQMIFEALQNRRNLRNNTTFDDVPLSIRNAHPDYTTRYGSTRLPIIPSRG